MDIIREIIYFTLIAAIGFFFGDLFLGEYIFFSNIVGMLIVSFAFTIFNFAIGNRIRDSIVLFFVNVFIVYLLDLLFPFFTITTVWMYFAITLVISIVDAVINSREE